MRQEVLHPKRFLVAYHFSTSKTGSWPCTKAICVPFNHNMHPEFVSLSPDIPSSVLLKGSSHLRKTVKKQTLSARGERGSTPVH